MLFQLSLYIDMHTKWRMNRRQSGNISFLKFRIKLIGMSTFFNPPAHSSSVTIHQPTNRLRFTLSVATVGGCLCGFDWEVENTTNNRIQKHSCIIKTS